MVQLFLGFILIVLHIQKRKYSAMILHIIKYFMNLKWQYSKKPFVDLFKRQQQILYFLGVGGVGFLL